MNKKPAPFGETLLSWRSFRGLTQARLAEKARVPRPNLSDMEKGKREVTLGTLRALAAALEVSPGVLADGRGPGDDGPPMTRESLERIAGAAAGRARALDGTEERLAGHLKTVISPMSDMKSGLRGTNRAWLALRSALPREAVESLIQRAREKEALREPKTH